MIDAIEYRQQLMEQIAAGQGKTREQLVPWQDYDPITVDNQVWAFQQHQRNPNAATWTGD